jgi:hypothetical protein
MINHVSSTVGHSAQKLEIRRPMGVLRLQRRCAILLADTIIIQQIALLLILPCLIC